MASVKAKDNRKLDNKKGRYTANAFIADDENSSSGDEVGDDASSTDTGVTTLVTATKYFYSNTTSRFLINTAVLFDNGAGSHLPNAYKNSRRYRKLGSLSGATNPPTPTPSRMAEQLVRKHHYRAQRERSDLTYVSTTKQIVGSPKTIELPTVIGPMHHRHLSYWALAACV
ncbi:hypothetical protein C1H76_3048 [Elsinoe australis]|uniref:Uncharacterized protein n=1 Tax=Elsinoe australis TaxID=40998 RepID=A0A4U7B4R5_9PEZI|nr:hypothetical protein C1H76_3048 [Elsinoe australis]